MMTSIIPTKSDKCKGAILGTAIGDAIGWPNELRSKNKLKNFKKNDYFVDWIRSCNSPRYHNEKIKAGEYSDDTQMTIAVARSILSGNWEKELTQIELPFWLKYERGGGKALLKAARACEKKVLLWKSNYSRDYFNAGGNGAVMRILPHVISMAQYPDMIHLMSDVVSDTLITHGHPRAFLGATCYAFALDYLLRKEMILEYGELVSAIIEGRKVWGACIIPDLYKDWLSFSNQNSGYDYLAEWNAVLENMLQKLEHIRLSLKRGLMLDDHSVLDELGCFSKANGAGDVAILASIFLASRYANNPVLGIKIPAFQSGADTDTIASITGGLLGMLCGTKWIPIEWSIVQDYKFLLQLADMLFEHKNNNNFKIQALPVTVHDDEWRSSPIGKIRSIEVTKVPNGKVGEVIITKWQTNMGQTLFMKEVNLFSTSVNTHQKASRIKPYSQASLTENAEVPRDISSAITTTSPVSHEEDNSNKNSQKLFTLNFMEVDKLLVALQHNGSISFIMVLKIIKLIMKGEDTSEGISNQLNVSIAIVEEIKNYIGLV